MKSQQEGGTQNAKSELGRTGLESCKATEGNVPVLRTAGERELTPAVRKQIVKVLPLTIHSRRSPDLTKFKATILTGTLK